MAFDFPNSPVEGQIFAASSGMSYQYTNGAWAEYRPAVAPNYYTKLEADNAFVNVAGDTMTGPLVLNADPTAPLQAATKQYADGKASDAPIDNRTYGRYNQTWVDVPPEPPNDGKIYGRVRPGWVETLRKNGDTMTGALTLPADPTLALQAATKQYVDNKLVGLPAVVTISDTAPGSPAQGLLWWNSADGNLYVSYNDGNTTQWVQINSVGS